MHGDDQQVIVFGEPYQQWPQHRIARHIKFAIRRCGRSCERAVESIALGHFAEIEMRNGDWRRRSDDLYWITVAALECRAQDGVPRDDSIECAFQRARVERSANPVEVSAIVGGRILLELGEKPHSPLR